MFIKLTAPANLSSFKLGDAISFQGSATNEIVKVELLADEKVIPQLKSRLGDYLEVQR